MGMRYIGGSVGHYHLNINGLADDIKHYMESQLGTGANGPDPHIMDKDPNEDAIEVDDINEREGEGSDGSDDEIESSGDEYREDGEIADGNLDDYLVGGEYRI